VGGQPLSDAATAWAPAGSDAALALHHQNARFATRVRHMLASGLGEEDVANAELSGERVW